MKNNFEGGFILNGHVRSYTPKVSEESKMSKQGEQQSLHSLLPLGEGGRRPDEGADVVRHKTAEPKTCNHLITQSLVLDLPVASFANNEYAYA